MTSHACITAQDSKLPILRSQEQSFKCSAQNSSVMVSLSNHKADSNSGLPQHLFRQAQHDQPRLHYGAGVISAMVSPSNRKILLIFVSAAESGKVSIFKSNHATTQL
jgi:hypothetical protein